MLLGGVSKTLTSSLLWELLDIHFSTDFTSFKSMDKICCVELQRVPLKFHTKYLTHTLKETTFIPSSKFKSSQIVWLICVFETPPFLLMSPWIGADTVIRLVLSGGCIHYVRQPRFADYMNVDIKCKYWMNCLWFHTVVFYPYCILMA